MGLWFALAPASLIAGSLKPGIGGHNPVEASQAGSAVITGPHVPSFDDLYATYRRHNAVLDAADAPALAEAEMQVWSGHGPRPDAARAALAEASGGALATTRTALLYLLPAEAAS